MKKKIFRLNCSRYCSGDLPANGNAARLKSERPRTGRDLSVNRRSGARRKCFEKQKVKNLLSFLRRPSLRAEFDGTTLDAFGRDAPRGIMQNPVNVPRNEQFVFYSV